MPPKCDVGLCLDRIQYLQISRLMGTLRMWPRWKLGLHCSLQLKLKVAITTSIIQTVCVKQNTWNICSLLLHSWDLGMTLKILHFLLHQLSSYFLYSRYLGVCRSDSNEHLTKVNGALATYIEFKRVYLYYTDGSVCHLDVKLLALRSRPPTNLNGSLWAALWGLKQKETRKKREFCQIAVSL